jgi:hypothetical protein
LLLYGAIASHLPPSPLFLGAGILLMWFLSQGVAPQMEPAGVAAQQLWLEQKVSSQRLQKVEVVGDRLLGYGKFAPWQQQVLWRDLAPEDRMQVTPYGVSLGRRSPLPVAAFLTVGATVVGLVITHFGGLGTTPGLLGLGLMRQCWLAWTPPWLALGAMTLGTWGGAALLGSNEIGTLWGAGFLLLSADGWALLFPVARLPMVVLGARLALMVLAVVVRPEFQAIALVGMLLPLQPSWIKPAAPLTPKQEVVLWSLLLVSLLIVIPLPKLFPLLLNL